MSKALYLSHGRNKMPETAYLVQYKPQFFLLVTYILVSR